MDMTLEYLKANAVDSVKLSGAFSEIVGECNQEFNLRSEIQKNFPLVTWLLNTSLARQVRTNMFRSGRCGMFKDEDGVWNIKIPATLWSVPAESAATECCFVPFEFDKCAGTVPLNLLCLKDCNNITDELVQMHLKSPDVEGLASSSQTEAQVKENIAKLSFAFYQAMNAMWGHDDTYVTTTPLKPFHGMAEIMGNAAVCSIDGSNILTAFASLACRMSVLGGGASYIIAVNPIIYQSIEAEIAPDQYGRYPAGWSKVGGELRFNGARFVQDKFVPVDFADSVGEAWVLTGDSVGLYMMDNLIATDKYTRKIDSVTNVEGGCASDCTYYYNLGSAFNSNAAKIAKIVDIPITAACKLGTTDLHGIIAPKTLVPNVE